MRLAKIKEWSIFQKYFGFEEGIDITNETQVLFRKNVVIKNIIFISNLIYTLIFAIISVGETSNLVLTIICFPVTFLVNNMLKRTIFKNKDDLLKQQIAMYICCFYMFLTAILIYLRLKTSSLGSYLGEVGYILLYYSLVVVSFYQDKKMLKIVFQWVFVIVTILHFTLTYSIISKDYASSVVLFVTKFFVSKEFKDILLRTILLLIFMLVLYSIVNLSVYMQEERKQELIKRRAIQEDFTNVVKKIFDVTLNNKKRSNDEIAQINIEAIMSRKLASLMGMPVDVCDEISDFCTIHIRKSASLNEHLNYDNEEEFDELKSQTLLGSTIISRLELERKTEDIIRAHMEGSNDDEFLSRMRAIQNNRNSQIIMLCEMYVSLRSIKSYKKAFNHKVSMERLTNEYRVYFDADIFDRFVKFQDDFEKIYDEC